VSDQACEGLTKVMTQAKRLRRDRVAGYRRSFRAVLEKLVEGRHVDLLTPNSPLFGRASAAPSAGRSGRPSRPRTYRTCGTRSLSSWRCGVPVADICRKTALARHPMSLDEEVRRHAAAGYGISSSVKTKTPSCYLSPVIDPRFSYQGRGCRVAA
jgi:hypothetical protein